MTTTDQHRVRSGAEKLEWDDPRLVEQMTETVARCAVDVVRARRPVHAISRFVTPDVSAMLARRAELTVRLRALSGKVPPQHAVVTGVRICQVNEKVVETSCVLREPDRARFLAMRWELRRRGWRVTVLEMG